VTVAQEAPGFWRASVRYGFMERPNTPRLLAQLRERGCTIDLADVTYYVRHETVTRREDGGACHVSRRSCSLSWSATPPT
jgi:KUP system potassium uptake protein